VVEILDGDGPAAEGDPMGRSGGADEPSLRRGALVAIVGLVVGVVLGGFLAGAPGGTDPGATSDRTGEAPITAAPVEGEGSVTVPPRSEQIAELARPALAATRNLDRLEGPVAIGTRPRLPNLQVWVLDRSTLRARTDLMLARPGFPVWWTDRLAFITEGRLVTLDPTLAGPPTEVNAGFQVIPASDRRYAWAITASLEPGETTVSRLDADTGARTELVVRDGHWPAWGVGDALLLSDWDTSWSLLRAEPGLLPWQLRSVPVEAIPTSAVGPRVAFLVGDHDVLVADVFDDQQVQWWHLRRRGQPRWDRACLSADGGRLALLDEGGDGRVLDVDSGEELLRFGGPTIHPLLAWTGPDQLLYSADRPLTTGLDGPSGVELRVLDVRTGVTQPIATVSGGDDPWYASAPAGWCGSRH
jgi:hypothetical protein